MFEIGDKVIYQGADKAAYRREGTVVSIEDKDGKPQLTVELDGGETFTAPIDDWSRKFNNACTSTNSVVRNAMAAHGVARNAKTQRFGYNVKAKIDDGGRCAIEISLTPNTKRTLEGRTWAICKRYASAVLNELRVKAQELESAIAWMDQNAQ